MVIFKTFYFVYIYVPYANILLKYILNGYFQNILFTFMCLMQMGTWGTHKGQRGCWSPRS